MVYRTTPFPMTFKDRYSEFQGHTRNGTRYRLSFNEILHCVPKKHVTMHVFDDKLNWNCPFTTIFGTLITKSVGRRQIFLFSNLTYFVHLLYFGKLSRPKYQ